MNILILVNIFEVTLSCTEHVGWLVEYSGLIAPLVSTPLFHHKHAR